MKKEINAAIKKHGSKELYIMHLNKEVENLIKKGLVWDNKYQIEQIIKNMIFIAENY